MKIFCFSKNYEKTILSSPKIVCSCSCTSLAVRISLSSELSLCSKEHTCLLQAPSLSYRAVPSQKKAISLFLLLPPTRPHTCELSHTAFISTRSQHPQSFSCTNFTAIADLHLFPLNSKEYFFVSQILTINLSFAPLKSFHIFPWLSHSWVYHEKAVYSFFTVLRPLLKVSY